MGARYYDFSKICTYLSGTGRKTLPISRFRREQAQPSLTPWFDVELPLNHDLVAIIGKKNSGKSALADVVALVGDKRFYR
jgi:hypothetical protein